MKACFFTVENRIPLSVDFFQGLDDTGGMTVVKTHQGFLRIKSRFARKGIQEYGAGELRRWGVPIQDDVPDNAIVRVYRDPKDVFDVDSMKSFEHAPVTLGHRGSITPKNFKDHAVGMSLSPVVRDSDDHHIGVDIMLMREDGITDYKKGIRELSGGYSSEIVLKGGITADGEPYDLRQRKIKGNHIALVPKGRAGTARLLDTRDSLEEEEMSEKVHQDAVELGKVRQQLEDAKAEISKLTKERDELKGKVTTLEAEKLTDEQFQEKISEGVKQAREAEKARELIIERAKKFAPKMVVDGLSNAEIMKRAILARNPKAEIGDADQNADFVRGMFEALVEPQTKTKTKTEDSEISFGDDEYVTFDAVANLLS